MLKEGEHHGGGEKERRRGPGAFLGPSFSAGLPEPIPEFIVHFSQVGDLVVQVGQGHLAIYLEIIGILDVITQLYGVGGNGTDIPAQGGTVTGGRTDPVEQWYFVDRYGIG